MRKVCFAVIALMLIASGAFADSISPSSYSTTLAPGASVTIAKTVTVDRAPTAPVDVFFLADTTGSMGGVIAAVQASASSILSSTVGLGNLAWGVGEYKDFGDVYVYRENQDLTTSQAAAQTGINMWGASGGGDTPEANLFALETLSTATSWRAGSTRILVWMGDAPGHDPSGGSTLASATAALNAQNIDVQAVNVGNLDGSGQASAIAAATGGTYYPGINSGSIVATITAAIAAAVNTYTTVDLDLSGAPAGVSVSSTPVGGYVGSYNRNTTQVFNFNVTFTAGLVPGTYDFSIGALVDGATVASELDHIVVSAVPEPGFTMVLGAGLAGLAVWMRRRRANV